MSDFLQKAIAELLQKEFDIEIHVGQLPDIPFYAPYVEFGKSPEAANIVDSTAIVLDDAKALPQAKESTE